MFGEIDEIVLLRDPSGRSRRCAFVRMKGGKESAEKAISSLNERIQFEDQTVPMVVKFADEQETIEAVQTEEGDVTLTEEGPPGGVLVVYGLDSSYFSEPSKFTKMFEPYGTIIGSQVFHSKGSADIYYGKISFNTSDAADAAIERLSEESDIQTLCIKKRQMKLP
ncbi:hypothetical protein GEMRC1_009434 [Eukaryota sp. GEM-RC1]